MWRGTKWDVFVGAGQGFFFDVLDEIDGGLCFLEGGFEQG